MHEALALILSTAKKIKGKKKGRELRGEERWRHCPHSTQPAREVYGYSVVKADPGSWA